jgi:hypothetical protein
LRKTTKRSLASPTLQTRTSKKKKLNLLNQSSSIQQKATLPRKAVGKVDTAIGQIVQATRKVVVAIIKATIRVKDANVVVQGTKEASMTATEKTVTISPNANTNNMEMAKSDPNTTEIGTKDKVAVEAEPIKMEANATGPENFSTYVKSMNKVRLTWNQTIVSFTATTTTFSSK